MSTSHSCKAFPDVNPLEIASGGRHFLPARWRSRIGRILCLKLPVTVFIMSVAPVSAAQAIGEHLQSPDDLAKIAAFRKKLEKEKASIDARLTSGAKEQLDATREGLKRLFSTRNNVQVIKDELLVIEREGNDPRNVVATFDQISRVSRRSPAMVSISMYACALGVHGSSEL